MANSLKGEVAFEALGATHMLCFDFNALVELEDALEGADPAELARVTKGKMRTLRTVFWAGLRPTNGLRLTQDQAGDLISDIGAERAGDLIAEAFRLAQPEGDANAPAGPRKRLPKTA